MILLLATFLAGASVQTLAPPAGTVVVDDALGRASTLRAADLRIASVTFRLAVSGRRFCPTLYPATGLLLHHLAEYDAAGQRMQLQRYPLDRGPGVLSVVAGGPAALAGLRAGDVLLSANDRAFARPGEIALESDGDRRRRMIERDEALLEEALRLGPVRLRLLRGSEQREILLGSISACPARVRLANSRQPTAFSNRGYIILTTRVLELIGSDDELAVVIGHELGHHVLDHERRLDQQKVPQGILRGFGKNASRIRAVEMEADRFGLRIAAESGYDIAATSGMWKRLARVGWRGPQLFRTHPSVADRKRMIEDVLAEAR